MTLENSGIPTNESLSDCYRRAIALTESSNPGEAVDLLESLQRRVAQLSLFSKNESLADISTGALPLLSLEHHLAVALVALPVSLENMRRRSEHLFRACDLWISFLENLGSLELLSTNEKQQLEEYTEFRSELLSSTPSSTTDPPSALSLPPPVNRDIKIQRFRAKQELKLEQQRLGSLLERRVRLGVADDDEMDGYDSDSLARSVALAALTLAKSDALDEMGNALQELPMVLMKVRQQDSQQSQHSRYHPTDPASSLEGISSQRASGQPPRGPLQVTRVTQDAVTGQLNIKREEIRSQVFRPGWNQPTMSLEELAEREVRDAIVRGERQKVAEAEAQAGPRRYELLKRDGMEDNVDLVDASAALDRRWDDWKDENPRGSGNKRGDVGDRNF